MTRPKPRRTKGGTARSRGRPFIKGQSGNPPTRFAKGASPNPGGRPRRTMAEFRELFSEDTEVIMKALKGGAIIGLARGTSAGVAAAHEFLDRIWGKSPQPITGGDGGPVRIAYDAIRSRLHDTHQREQGASPAGDPTDQPPTDPDPEPA